MKNAIITVSNKDNIDKISEFLLNNDFNVFSTGGTYKKLVESNPTKTNQLIKISDYTNFPEILEGRVKTLHPKIYGGILADLNLETHLNDIKAQEVELFSVVIVNLYPFEQQNCIENIDIGGVSLIRAAAKNFKHVSVLTNPSQYVQFINNFSNITDCLRHDWARDAFEHVLNYDKHIYNYFNRVNETCLKYGLNPHQTPSTLVQNGAFDLINGTLGYINVLDFLNGWLMTFEIAKVTNKVAFISMKHTSPAGLGIGTSISNESLDIFGVDEETRNNLTSYFFVMLYCP